MKIDHAFTSSFDLPLALPEALAFVRDAEASLYQVHFMRGLRAETVQGRTRVRAEIPVDVPLVGSYALEFVSLLESAPRGATLKALPLENAEGKEGKKGWAEVAGEAELSPLPAGSRVRYRFDIRVHVGLPEPERWGGRALLKMIEVTAQKVVADIGQDFPEAVRHAAHARSQEAPLGAQ